MPNFLSGFRSPSSLLVGLMITTSLCVVYCTPETVRDSKVLNNDTSTEISQDTVTVPFKPGVWSRVDEETIKFVGNIAPNSIDDLEKVLKSTDRVLIVNSPGGEVTGGLRIGQRILPLKMTVVVDGQCASSCANYIFTAGAQKVIRSGWVGFHGNLSAGMTVGQSYNRNSLKKEGLTEYEIEQNIINGQKGAIQEAAFLNEIGVKQELFDKSWLGGNGPTKSYEFLCPTPAAMERYGIMNVTGNQDLSATPQSLLEE